MADKNGFPIDYPFAPVQDMPIEAMYLESGMLEQTIEQLRERRIALNEEIARKERMRDAEEAEARKRAALGEEQTISADDVGDLSQVVSPDAVKMGGESISP